MEVSMLNEGGPSILVRYCIRGHEIEYREGGIARSRCPVCGSPVDRSRPPMTLEDVQKMNAEAAAKQQEAEAAAQQPYCIVVVSHITRLF